MNDTLQFATRGEFRAWLEDHCLSEEGIWLVLCKAGGPKTIKAGEALEEALCFGWIDGQMQSLDDKTYRKYFSQRRGTSKWSEKDCRSQSERTMGRAETGGGYRGTNCVAFRRFGSLSPSLFQLPGDVHVG